MGYKHYLIRGYVPTLPETVKFMKNLINYKISMHERYCCYNTIQMMMFVEGEYKYMVLRAYDRIVKHSKTEELRRISNILESVKLKYLEAVETFERHYGTPKQVTIHELMRG